VALTTGSRIGPYEITSPLGEGGMGVVYRAHDTKLGRDVAIKALPDAFANDADRLQRFQREAQVLASLNHPNIAQIYGLEESDKTRCIVMELVEGQTLQERLRRGPIPLDEALPMASQIATALEAAHERGIVHRDLKPANIKLTPDGKVKVLDFGLAKAFQEEHQPTLSNSPTLIGASAPGVILGTAAYMSPEQARGKEADRSSDIWAFGCVLYEMITGHAAFEGETIGEILAGVFKAEPDWNRLPAQTPEAIRRLLRRGLQKDRSRRLNSANDARIEIEEGLKAPTVEAPPDAARIRQPRLAWIVAVIAMLAFASLALVHFRERPAPEPPEMRLEITTPSTSAPLEFALSPDGRYIVFVASGDGPQRLWLRALDKTDAQPMAGTEGADFPFWSADSRSIGFYAVSKLKRIDIAGGLPQVLADAVGVGGAWNADGTIVFNSGSASALSRINASGGDPAPVTRLGSQQTTHRFPNFLPDGRHFLFYVSGTPEASGIYLASLDGGEPKRLSAADSMGFYLAPDLVVFKRGTTLIGRHLDLRRGELTGEPVRLADFGGGSVASGQAGLSVSSNGRIAYRAGGETAQRRLKWYDRNGKPSGVAGEPDAAGLLYPELSPDGRQVAMSRTVQGNTDIWLMDLVRGGMTRFTFDVAIDTFPVWSPDGMRIAFASNRKGATNLYVKPSSGAGAEQPLLETPNAKGPVDWSKDGRFLLYVEADAKSGLDLWALTITGSDRKSIAVAKTAFVERNGQFSPNGHFVAYETNNESSQFQIVVQPFPEPTGKWQVSTGGGTQARWRADGKELYFVAPDGKLMVASVTVEGSAFAAGTPVALFPTSIVTGGAAIREEYAVSRDGRFLINTRVDESTPTPITLILNWRGALAARDNH
jgi:serine/threonine protein kinase/Tol biopolymer transport system component